MTDPILMEIAEQFAEGLDAADSDVEFHISSNGIMKLRYQGRVWYGLLVEGELVGQLN